VPWGASESAGDAERGDGGPEARPARPSSVFGGKGTIGSGAGPLNT
jgi:hypothetical protein